MANRDEKAPSTGASAPVPGRFFNRVRDALFESNQPQPQTQTPSFDVVEGPPLPVAPSGDTQLDTAMLTSLRELLAKELGPTLSEFNLQLDAVREIVPDSTTRLRIAMSVLEKRGMPLGSVQAELQRVLMNLNEQQRAFSEKVELRRREQAEQSSGQELEHNELCVRIEREIESLQAAIGAQRQAFERAQSERAERQQAALQTQAELEQKERAFQSAAQHLASEYKVLADRIASIAGEKS
ncbi:MAG: hypothetical protein QM756_13980 [Polyangiaceae bacterium]